MSHLLVCDAAMRGLTGRKLVSSLVSSLVASELDLEMLECLSADCGNITHSNGF